VLLRPIEGVDRQEVIPARNRVGVSYASERGGICFLTGARRCEPENQRCSSTAQLCALSCVLLPRLTLILSPHSPVRRSTTSETPTARHHTPSL